MNGKVFTAGESSYIRKRYMQDSAVEMAEHLECSPRSVLRIMRQKGLVVPKEVAQRIRVKKLIGRSSSTLAIDIFLEMNYLLLGEKPMAREINKSSMFVRTRLKQLGLVTPRHIIEQRIKDSRIKPGTVPQNKGKRIEDYVGPEALARVRASQFRKGNVPPNAKYDGAKSVRKYTQRNGVKKQYTHIRISKGKWKMLHVKIWEDKNGPLPAGKILVFKNKDTTDIRLSNLKMVDRKNHMLNNTIHRFPEELKEVIRLTAKLKRRTNETRPKTSA